MTRRAGQDWYNAAGHGTNDIMSSFPAKADGETRRVVIVVYPEVTLLDATGPAEVFSTAARPYDAGPTGYRIVIASKDGGLIEADGGVVLGSVTLEEASAEPIDTLLIAGGFGVFDAAKDPAIIDWIAREGPRARRFGTTCMGTFLPAAAGMLKGRRVVTHWRWCERLKQEHPDLDIEEDAIFVRDGDFWSSAGVTSGIDMALAMVEEDFGHDLALEVARRLVVYLKRPGGQSQFSETLNAQAADPSDTLNGLHVWMRDNITGDLRVENLADKAGMSPRNFARVYRQRFGVTPAKAVEAMRVETAKRLLLGETTAIAEVARQSGFQDDERMRRAFVRQTGIAPVDYRKRFGTRAAAAD